MKLGCTKPKKPETRMPEKIVIIGNGMDIDHGKPTRWKQIFESHPFSADYKNATAKTYEIVNYAEMEDWADFEKFIAQVSKASRGIFKDYKNATDDVHRIGLNLFSERREFIERVFDKVKQGGDYSRDTILKIADNEDPENYHSDRTREIIALLNNKILKLMETKPNKLKKYEDEFNEKTFVINYNYTTWYSGMYYSPYNVYHIHGIVKEEFKESDIEANMIPVDGILLGYYNDGSEFSTLPINLEYNSYGVPDEQFLTIADCVEEYLGNKHMYFNKNVNSGSSIKYEKGLHYIYECLDTSKVEEIVFIGHSLSENDLDPLFHKMDFDSIKKIKIIIWWDSKEAIDNIVSKIEKYFAGRNIEFEFINNNNDESYICKSFKTNNI